VGEVGVQDLKFSKRPFSFKKYLVYISKWYTDNTGSLKTDTVAAYSSVRIKHIEGDSVFFFQGVYNTQDLYFGIKKTERVMKTNK
jgi:hypothetical protein